MVARQRPHRFCSDRTGKEYDSGHYKDVFVIACPAQ
jgi:hypothetical protein